MTVRQGYELNYPLLAVTTMKHSGPLPASKSFFGTQEDNVVITAIKKDVDDNSLIVRFYEWAGKKGDVHLTLPEMATSASADEPDGEASKVRSALTQPEWSSPCRPTRTRSRP